MQNLPPFRKVKKALEVGVHGIGIVATISALIGTGIAYMVSMYWSSKLGGHLLPEIFSKLSIDIVIMTVVLFLILFAIPILIVIYPGLLTVEISGNNLNFGKYEKLIYPFIVLSISIMAAICAVQAKSDDPGRFFWPLIISDIAIMIASFLVALLKRIKSNKSNQNIRQNIKQIGFPETFLFIVSFFYLFAAQTFAFIVYYVILNLSLTELSNFFIKAVVVSSLIYPIIFYLLYIFLETKKFVLSVSLILSIIFLVFIFLNISSDAIIKMYGGYYINNFPSFYIGDHKISSCNDADYFSFRSGNHERFALYCDKKLRYKGLIVLYDKEIKNDHFANIYHYTECGSVWNNNGQSKKTLLCKSYISLKKVNYCAVTK